jgi:hypothetical protein
MFSNRWKQTLMTFIVSLMFVNMLVSSVPTTVATNHNVAVFGQASSHHEEVILAGPPKLKCRGFFRCLAAVAKEVVTYMVDHGACAACLLWPNGDTCKKCKS